MKIYIVLWKLVILPCFCTTATAATVSLSTALSLYIDKQEWSTLGKHTFWHFLPE